MVQVSAEQPIREGGRLVALVESGPFSAVIMTLIVLNAMTLGLETYPAISARFGHLIEVFDAVVITVFVIEIALKFCAYRLRYFSDGWRLFDLFVVGVSLIPNAGPFTVLRALRVMRLFRVLSLSGQMRRAVEALFRAIPAMGGIMAVLTLIFYVFAVMATRLFGDTPDGSFATLGESALTLFQVMTLEGWAEVMAAVRVAHPWAWLFFIAFIFLSSFAVLNLFIAVIVDALQEETFTREEARDERERAQSAQHHDALMGAVAELRREVADLREEARRTQTPPSG